MERPKDLEQDWAGGPYRLRLYAAYAKELEAELKKIKDGEDWNCSHAMAMRILELEARIEKTIAWHGDDGGGGCRVCPRGARAGSCNTVLILRGEE